MMDWGGWEDWEPFRRSYLGEFSPRATPRERGTVELFDGAEENAQIVHPESTRDFDAALCRLNHRNDYQRYVHTVHT